MVEPDVSCAVKTKFDTITLARVTVGARTEVRVQVLEWEGVRSLDIRTWSMPTNADEYRPTPRGARIPFDRVPDLIAALQTACIS